MITYEVGDATIPFNGEKTLIIHVVNNIGAWGSGFVVPLGERYPEAKEVYTNRVGNMALGTVDLIPIKGVLVTVANMCAQNGIKGPGNPHPLKYGPLAKCLDDTCYYAARSGFKILAPKFGADRGGGDWSKIEVLFDEALDAYGVEAVVRTLS